MAFNLKVARGAVSTTGGGTAPITSAGFGAVKGAILFMGRGVTDDALAPAASFSLGFMDGTNQGAFATSSADAANPTITVRDGDASNAVLERLNFDRGAGTFITDGVLITTDAGQPFDTPDLCSVLLLGGDDIEAVTVGSFAPDGVNPVPISPGFDPRDNTLILMLNNDSAGNATEGLIGVGIAHYDGALTQRSFCWLARHNSDPANVYSVVGDAEILTMIQNGPVQIDWRAGLSNFTATTFDWTPLDGASVPAANFVEYIAIKLAPGVDCDVFTYTVSAGDGAKPKTGLSGQPQGGLILTNKLPAFNVLNSTDADSLGATIWDGTNVLSTSASDQDGVIPSVAKSISTSGALKCLGAGDGVDAAATFVSNDANGFTWNFAPAPAATRQYIGFTLGSSGPSVPPRDPPFDDSVVYNCVEIPSDSILYYAGGTQDGGTSATVFTDSTASYTINEFVDLIIENRTDGSRGVVTANDATTITVASLTGGTENDWDDGDVMAVVADIDNPDIIYYESPVSVVSESVDIDWYIYDDDTTIYSPLYTQTISGLTGVADGSYTTSLDACGSITLTPVVLVPATLSNPTLVPTPGSTTSVDYSVTTDTVDGVMWLRYSQTFPQTDAWIKGGTSTPVTGTLFSGTTVGASPGETYYAYFLQETAAGDSNQQSAVTTMPLEIAVLTNEVADVPPFNTVTARVDTDQNGGDLRYLLNTSATAVEADLLGVGSRSQAVSQNVTQTITWSGAPTNTLVYVHFMQVTVGNSLVVSTAGVTTGEEVPVPPTSTINDAILIVTGGPTVNDGLATWYGQTASETLPDAERRWLIEQGATSAHRNDMWFEFTGNLGYQGALPDRQLQYWLNGGAGGAALVTFQGQQVTHLGEDVTNG